MFNYEFDNNLWIILENDSEYRYEILNLLRLIPGAMIEDISDYLDSNKLYDEYFNMEKKVQLEDGSYMNCTLNNNDSAGMLSIRHYYDSEDEKGLVIEERLVLMDNRYESDSVLFVGGFYKSMQFILGRDIPKSKLRDDETISLPFDTEEFANTSDGIIIDAYGQERRIGKEYVLRQENGKDILIMNKIVNNYHSSVEIKPLIRLKHLPNNFSINYIESKYGDDSSTKNI